MKVLFDLFPVILFFCAYWLGKANPDASQGVVAHYFAGITSGGPVSTEQAAIMLATAIAIVATVVQIAYLLVRGRKVDGMLWLSLAIIIVTGGLTIYFHDEDFIKWKPTLLYWAFAIAMFVSHFMFGNNLMRKVMETQIKLPDPIWKRVDYAWMGFFAFMGVLNAVMAFIVFKGNTGAWVNFKLFGSSGLTFVFIVAQTLILSKHVQEEDA
jgi:intracellular septation protein